jgi:hypothetical protein
MKNEKVKIDPIDEALKLVTLNTENQDEKGSQGLTLLNIISAEYKSQPSAMASERMIDQLFKKLSIDSFGVLINKELKKVKMDATGLSEKSGLPVFTIEQLQSDRILANSIPVIHFKNLLKTLQIPFDVASEAIFKTFELIKNESTLSMSFIGSSKFAYRRKSISVPSSVSSKNSLTESQVLFQNEEALKKYLNRLKELYES